MSKQTRIVIFVFITIYTALITGEDLGVEYLACNENVCAPVVSFCLFTKQCNIDTFATNQTGVQICTKCLGYLYQDCCSCIGLCKPSVSELEPIMKSNVELISEPDTEMFQLLAMQQTVREGQWRMMNLTYKVQIHIDGPDPSTFGLNSNQSGPQIIPPGVASDLEVNCTVAYLSQCMAMNKCRDNCEVIGASAYRWFHNACCQCVGPCELHPYGDDQAKCDLCFDDIPNNSDNEQKTEEEQTLNDDATYVEDDY